MDPAPHGALFEPQDLRNLAHGEPDNLLENQRHAKLVWKERDGTLKALARLRVDLLLQRVILLGGNKRDQRLAEREQRIKRADVLGLTRPLAMHALARPRRDAIEPSPLARFAPELTPRPKRAQEDLLDEVLGLLTSATKTERQLVEMPPVLIHEPLQRSFGGAVAHAIGIGTGRHRRHRTLRHRRFRVPTMQPATAVILRSRGLPTMSDHDRSDDITGHALAFFAFDIGFQVDLDTAEPLVAEATRRRVVRARRPAPVWFDYSPPPLQLVVGGNPVRIDETETAAAAEVLIYDFGCALLTYRMPLPDNVADLPGLGIALYEHADLEADARERVAAVLDAIRPAVERPNLADAVEDYAVFVVTAWGDRSPTEVVESCRELLARALEAERATLSEAQTRRTTEAMMSYAESDLAIIDWNAALLFDADPDDVISVLQHANIELLELRVLDQELDAILDHADETLAALTKSRFWPVFASGGMLRRFASVQTDAAVMFEGVNNAIKLLGNQYLARLYRLTATRLDLPAWQASVQRKLDATESLYQKMSDSTSTRRLEVLEWVIIILITISIVLPFTPWYH